MDNRKKTSVLMKNILSIIVIIVILFFDIYRIIYIYNSRKKIKLVEKNDYDTVEKYYKSCIFDKLNKDNKEYDLYDAF